jgi:RNA polymerase sigma-70 factor (ECF subfamily)
MLTGCSNDAWDLVQSTFEKAIRSPPPRYRASEVRSWLGAIMRNLFIDDWRARKVREHVSLTRDLASILPETVEDVREPALWESISVIDVERLTSRLSPPVRAAFIFSVEGLSVAEIAARLQVPIPTVSTRIFRGRRHLRRMLEDAGGISASAR